MGKIIVIVKEPGKAAHTKTIDNTLEELQRLVGGYIEPVPTNDDHLAVYVDEEGLLKHLEPNDFGLVGTIIVTGFDPDTGNNVSLTEQQTMLMLAAFDA